MKEIIEHIKRIAIEDTRLFFEPYVKVFRFIRSRTRAASGWIKRKLREQNKGDDQ